MASTRVFGTIANGEIEIILYSDEYAEGAEKVVCDAFYAYETVCVSCELHLPESAQARTELDLFWKQVAEDGISLVAREKTTGKVVGVIFNKVQSAPINNEAPYFVDFMNNVCKTRNSKAFMQFMIDLEAQFDVFQHYNASCMVELMFLATLPEYRNKGIAKALCEYSVKLSKELKNGKSLDLLPEDLKDKRPEIALAIFSSPYSQKICSALKFDNLMEIKHSEYSYNGITFAERIGNIPPSSTLEALLL